MTDASVEFYASIFDSVEDSILPYYRRTGFDGGICDRRLRRAYNTNSDRGIDGVGKAYTVADCRAILESAELEMHFVFGRGGRTADFKGADVAKRGCKCYVFTEFEIWGLGKNKYRIASHKENWSASLRLYCLKVLRVFRFFGASFFLLFWGFWPDPEAYRTWSDGRKTDSGNT